MAEKEQIVQKWTSYTREVVRKAMNKTLFKDVPFGATFVYRGNTYCKVSATVATDPHGNNVEFSQYHTVVWHKHVAIGQYNFMQYVE